MAKKTFKIGEYAKGGIITAEVKGGSVTIEGKEWDYSKGSRRSSNQSNARVFTRLHTTYAGTNDQFKVEMFLLELTTSYYTDKIINWINSKLCTGK